MKLARARQLPLRAAACSLLVLACRVPDMPPLPDGAVAFGVFGDGPYQGWEERRFRRLIEDVDSADIEFLIHIGDVLWFPCSEEAYAQRLAALNTLSVPVVYTPGDNEWADCHQERPGGWNPLDRLARLRAIFFASPRRSIGGRPMPVESQADDSVHAEFVENARWRRGAFVFATLHMIGSDNGGMAFDGRTRADDAEVVRRSAAALDWMAGTFDAARAGGARTVVLALHGNPGLEREPAAWDGYEAFVARLDSLVAAFDGDVLLIHGDTHTQRVDHPLAPLDTREPYARFSRLETFGSPDIGWVRVVIDTVSGRVLEFQPRVMPGRIPFH